MTKIPTLLFILLFFSASFSQKKDEWIRIQSDDKEFAVEIPKKFSYFYDKAGFTMIAWDGVYQLSEMSVVNCYFNETLINLERYRVDEIAAAQPIIRTSSLLETELPTKRVSTILEKEEKNFPTKPTNTVAIARRYLFSKNFVYVLTVASRKGNTPEIDRFFNSYILHADGNGDEIKRSKRFSKLKQTKIKYSEDFQPSNNETSNNPPKIPLNPEEIATPLLFISNPRVPYSQEARSNNVKGIVQLEATFNENGQISNIVAKKPLDYGLVNITKLTLLRMKFLPELKTGKAISVIKTIDYEFNGY